MWDEPPYTQKQILVPIYACQYNSFLVAVSEHNDLGPPYTQ